MKFDRESLKTGVPLIDRQHEAYFKLVDRFFELTERGDIERATLEIEVNKIVEYAVEHFDAEEYLMRSISYPAYEAHLAKHNVFRDNLDFFTSELKGEVQMGAFIGKLSKWLIEWFTSQIRIDDRQLAAFINQTTKGEAPKTD